MTKIRDSRVVTFNVPVTCPEAASRAYSLPPNAPREIYFVFCWFWFFTPHEFSRNAYKISNAPDGDKTFTRNHLWRCWWSIYKIPVQRVICRRTEEKMKFVSFIVKLNVGFGYAYPRSHTNRRVDKRAIF